MNGATAFYLVDTIGLPLDLLKDELREKHCGFDVLGFVLAARSAGWPNKRIRATLCDGAPAEAATLIGRLVP